MRIGFLQFAPVLGDLRATIDRIDRLMSRADSADLIVLPELCNSGYRFASREEAMRSSEEIGDSAFLRHLSSRCREMNLHMVTGFNEREGDLIYNSSVLLGPGGYIGKYRKIHLFMDEKDYFAPSEGDLPVFDTGLCKIGMLVCFDWVFPEVWRILALKGADIICHPSNLVLPGLAQSAVPVHALTNRVYVVTANRIGTEGDLTFTGLSTVAGPGGDVLYQASRTEEVLHVLDIDPALSRDKKITPRNDVMGDRRPDLYALLTDRVGAVDE